MPRDIIIFDGNHANQDVYALFHNGRQREDLITIGKILEQKQCFVPGFIPSSLGLYNPDPYRMFNHEWDLKLYLDLNISTRLIKIAGGATIDEELRTVAAIRAFAGLTGIPIEPNISLYELAHTQNWQVVEEEFQRLNVAIKSDDSIWQKLALGHIEKFPTADIQNEKLPILKPLRRWEANYIATLKIAELEITNLKNIEKIKALLEWMENDFLFCAAAALLACVYFAPNSPPRKDLFKKLKSNDRSAAINGIKNVTWDITYLGEMTKASAKTSENEPRVIFASFDTRLRNIASLLFNDAWGDLAKKLNAWWPVSQAEAITKNLEKLRILNRPERIKEIMPSFEARKHDGEARLKTQR